MLRGTKREDVERGQVLAKPGTILLTQVQSRSIRTEQRRGVAVTLRSSLTTAHNSTSVLTDVTGAVTLEEGVEMVMPGENVTITVELIAPIAMEEGLRFAIREGGRTVGAGVVSSIIA